MNATATTADLVTVPAVSGTGRPNYVALNGRVHRATCKRRGTYKGGAAPMIGSAPMMARLEGVKPATCCKPEKAADWKAALAGGPADAPTLTVVRGEQAPAKKARERALERDAAKRAVVPEPVVTAGGMEVYVHTDGSLADAGTVTPATPHGTTRVTMKPAEEAPEPTADRVDSTERMVTLTFGEVKVRALYVERHYRGDAKKPYAGRWVLESNGATIYGGPTIGYTVNGEDAGKGPLGAVAAKAALRA